MGGWKCRLLQLGICAVALTSLVRPLHGEKRLCLDGAGAGRGRLEVIAQASAFLQAFDFFDGYYARLLQTADLRLCRDDSVVDARGAYEPLSGEIVFADGLSRDEVIFILAHELRHVDQWQRGLGFDRRLSADAHVHKTMVLEADAQAVALLFAWQAQQAGYPGPWHAAESFEHHADIARQFRSIAEDEGSVGPALRSAFGQWFNSPWRMEAYRYSSLSNYLDMLDEQHYPAGTQAFDRLQLQSICVLPDGVPYDCTPPFSFPTDR